MQVKKGHITVCKDIYWLKTEDERIYEENQSSVYWILSDHNSRICGRDIPARNDTYEFRYICRNVQCVQFSEVFAAGDSNERCIFVYFLKKNGTAAFFMAEQFYRGRNLDSCTCRRLDFLFGRNAAAAFLHEKRNTGNPAFFMLPYAAMAFVRDHVEKGSDHMLW